MKYLHETHGPMVALIPQSIDAASSATGGYQSVAGRTWYSFLVSLGAVAGGKSVKVELMGADNAQGTKATALGEITYTAPTGGVESRMVVVCAEADDAAPYVAVKVTNSGAAAVLASALFVGETTWHPDGEDRTVLVV